VVFVFHNLARSGVGRSLRAVRDDEIAASLAGLRVGRWQTLAFTLSAASAGLGGGLLAVVTGTVAPGAFPIQLSLMLLAGVVIGGLGSLVGAVWGAALLVFLPNWTNDLASSFSLSTNVAHNLPLAIYGAVLVGAMLVWPSGIQGALRAIGGRAGPGIAASVGRTRGQPAGGIDAGASAEPSAAEQPGADGPAAAQPASETGATTSSEG
jgi:branched-chain amino acid transport system permease protein